MRTPQTFLVPYPSIAAFGCAVESQRWLGSGLASSAFGLVVIEQTDGTRLQSTRCLKTGQALQWNVLSKVLVSYINASQGIGAYACLVVLPPVDKVARLLKTVTASRGHSPLSSRKPLLEYGQAPFTRATFVGQLSWLLLREVSRDSRKGLRPEGLLMGRLVTSAVACLQGGARSSCLRRPQGRPLLQERSGELAWVSYFRLALVVSSRFPPETLELRCSCVQNYRIRVNNGPVDVASRAASPMFDPILNEGCL